MQVWVDGIKPPPKGEWMWTKSVNATEFLLSTCGAVDKISIGSSAGEYECMGGDYINILWWILENAKAKVKSIEVHSDSPLRQMEFDEMIKAIMKGRRRV